MHFFVTGAAGYIGSHMVRLLQDKGHSVSLVDNFSNSSPEQLRKILHHENTSFSEVDVRDPRALDLSMTQAISQFGAIDGVFHFAGFKSVNESVEDPGAYYVNNVAGTLNTYLSAQKKGVRSFVFSSSATVYGESSVQPIPESAAIKPTNPYGFSKAMSEQMLLDLSRAGGPKVAILRYFNPVGAHPNGDLGEKPNGIPNNIVPYVCKVALGEISQLTVFGNDYVTTDGTGVRDYIHVCDLVEGHWAALVRTLEMDNANLTVNLGTGQATSVLSLIKVFSESTGYIVPYAFGERRPGDVATAYADTKNALLQLGWEARRPLHEMMKSHFNFAKNNR